MKKTNPYNKFIYLLLVPIVFLVGFFLIGLFAFSGIKSAQDESTLSNIILFIYSISTFMILIIISIYNRIVDSLSESSMSQLKLEKYQMNQEFSDELSVKADQLDKLKQEFDKHFSTIQESLYQENYDGLKEYLDSITGHIESSNDIIITNHYIISSLLQSKKSICDKLNISLDLDINFSKIYRLSDLDTIILLGNILDNAIEANEKVEEDKRYINLTMKQLKSYLKISCENPFSKVPVEKKGVLLTTKPDKEFHGIGLSNVKDTCLKYNGKFKYTFDNKTFYIELKLPNYSST